MIERIIGAGKSTIPFLHPVNIPETCARAVEGGHVECKRKSDFPLEDEPPRCRQTIVLPTKCEAIEKIRSLLNDTEGKEYDDENQAIIALNMFQYLARPKIIHWFDDYSHFQQLTLDKIDELERNPHVQRNSLFASAFTTIKERWSPLLQRSCQEVA
jgi:hypothetical protein